MSDAAATHGEHDEAAHLAHYMKIYRTLVVLFLVSVSGPFISDHFVHSKALVLVTAFGIALVKAYLVCAHFMHLNVEKKFVIYMLTTALVFMFLFFAGVSPDIMEHRGRNWENVAAREETASALKEQAERAAHPGEHEGAEHAE